MSYLFKIFVLFQVLITCVNTTIDWTLEDEKCELPNKEFGLCIPLKSCKPVYKQLENLGSFYQVSTELTKFLRNHHCGFDNNDPKVCCFLKNLERIETRKPPDVSKHKNLELVPQDCGIIDTSDRIVNGDKTGLLEFPWMALLGYQDKKKVKYGCAGTIINKNYILTAAHCLKSKNLITVRVGEYDLENTTDCETTDNESYCAPPVQDLTIEEKISHPHYNKWNYSHDIGLLRVSRMNFAENVKPICLPLNKSKNFNFTNRKVLITGWGITETGKPSTTLLKASISTIPYNKCVQKYKNRIQITQNQLCAGGNNADSCKGDSGGPLQVLTRLYGDTRMVQQGIVSFGKKYCAALNPMAPGVYTNVPHYLDWILDNIKP